MVYLKSFLKFVDLNELHEKINNFRDLNFKSMTYQDVQAAVSNVINFDTPYGNICILTPSNANYPAGTRFYRVRTLPENDRNLPLKNMSKVSDCWEPPINIVRMGRLNKDNESLLYTSPIVPNTAIEEMKISDGELFSLIVYEATEQINVTMIGLPPKIEDLDTTEILKMRMIQDFLKHEFIRDVGIGTEYLYRISESITKDYFDLPPKWQDAWCYPSVAKKGSFNVCFRKEKRKKLKLVGVQLASIIRENDNMLYNIRMVAKDSGDGDNLQYFLIGSEEQKEFFPEILTKEI